MSELGGANEHAGHQRRIVQVVDQKERRRFAVGLGCIVTAALVFRVVYVLLVTRHEDTRVYDSYWYQQQALNLTRGHFFPALPPYGHGPDALHPPMTSLVLVPVTYLFGLHPGETPQRITMAVFGALVVLLVGILARALGGVSVGLVAASVAALYPNMWMPSGILMSETLVMTAMALVLLSTYRLLRVPTWPNAAYLGLSCGIAMLVRAEVVLLVPFLLVPAAFVCKHVSLSGRIRLAAIGMLVVCITVGPWVGRNLVSFRDTTLLTTSEGPVLAGANCPGAYHGPLLGFWVYRPCSFGPAPPAEQSVLSARQFNAGTTFIEHHLSRLPIVVLARVGRVWDFYKPTQNVDLDVGEGRPAPAAIGGLFAYYLLLPFAGVGLVTMRRRGIKAWPLLVPAAIVTLTAASEYGLIRFRAEFEVPLVILAAMGMVAARRRWEHRLSPHLSS